MSSVSKSILMMTLVLIVRSNKVKLATDLKNDFQSVVIWGKKWLVNFNTSKLYLLIILENHFAFHKDIMTIVGPNVSF